MANDQERAAFEAWARRARGFSDRYLAQQPDGYENEVVEGSWVGWQACAALAELDALRKDAERYRWLRHGDNDETVMRVYDREAVGRVRPFDPTRDAAFLPRSESLDAAIDAAMELHNARLSGAGTASA